MLSIDIDTAAARLAAALGKYERNGRLDTATVRGIAADLRTFADDARLVERAARNANTREVVIIEGRYDDVTQVPA